MGAELPTSLEGYSFQSFERSCASVIPVAVGVAVVGVCDWEVEQRWIAWHHEELAESPAAITGAVDFPDIQVFLMQLVELVPDWGEALAVAAPRSEEIDEPRSVRQEAVTALCQDVVVEELLIE